MCTPHLCIMMYIQQMVPAGPLHFLLPSNDELEAHPIPIYILRFLNQFIQQSIVAKEGKWNSIVLGNLQLAFSQTALQAFLWLSLTC